MMPYVAQLKGAKKGIAESMYYNVSVRVGNQALAVRYIHSAKDKPKARCQKMYVVTVSYSEIHAKVVFCTKVRFFPYS